MMNSFNDYVAKFIYKFGPCIELFSLNLMNPRLPLLTKFSIKMKFPDKTDAETFY